MWFWKRKKNIGKVCLCTITNSAFIPGTCVMLHTFFKYNPWFEGDVIIVDHELEKRDRSLLEVFPNVKFITPPPELSKAVEPIYKVRPDIAHSKVQFNLLALFNLSGYDKYIYVDGDAFFQASIFDQVSKVKSIMFSPDRPSHLGIARDACTYKMAHDHDGSNKYWYQTFNTGVIISDDTYFTQSVYLEMLDLLQPDFFLPLKRSANDQYLINRYFRENYYPLSAKYNYRLGLAPILEKEKGLTLDDAAIIHFSGKKNPWIPDHVFSATQKEPLYVKAMSKWLSEYESFLATLTQHKN